MTLDPDQKTYIDRWQSRRNDPSLEGNPLLTDFDDLLDAYVALSARFSKIVKISDGYQRTLKDYSRRLDVQSHTDVLTGLPNRRAMVERLEAEWSRHQRRGATLSLLMVDLDRFKDVNDDFGHDAGDEALRALAAVFSYNLRREDFCARWGGEEFLVCLPETTPGEALNVAEKLREQIAKIRLESAAPQLKVTTSVGGAALRPDEDLEDFLKRIDRALYRAKEEGRDRVVFL